MNNLKLVTTETFGDLSCNFYRNMNDDILLTREQIGQALEYANPDAALSIIHKKHKDRLDDLSVVTKLISTDGKEYNTRLYTERGIMEICRWSRQKRANEFMDWVWDVIETYRHNDFTPQLNLQPLADSIAALTEVTTQLQKDVSELKSLSNTTTSTPKSLPTKTYSRWKTSIFNKLRILTDYANEHSDQELKLSDTLHITINEMQDTYNLELSDYTNDYMLIHSLETRPYDLDVIDYYKDIRNIYTTTLDTILEKLNLKSEIAPKRNIFDELASRIAS